jgi:hypothetical protein
MLNVLVRRTGLVDIESDSFAPFRVEDDLVTNVSQLAAMVCTEFSHWQAHASQTRLFLVPVELARKISGREIVFDPTDSQQHPLFEGDTLAQAQVIEGSYLLALVPPPPPASGKNQLFAVRSPRAPLFAVLRATQGSIPSSCLPGVSNGWLACDAIVGGLFVVRCPSRACAGDGRVDACKQTAS